MLQAPATIRRTVMLVTLVTLLLSAGVARAATHPVVLVANSAELDELAQEPRLDHLSGDLPVRTWMSVSNKATAADQTRAGYAGGLLGLGQGAMPFGLSDVWTGGYNNGTMFRVDGGTGLTKDEVQLPNGCSPYGLVVDLDGYAWAPGLGPGASLCLFDTATKSVAPDAL